MSYADPQPLQRCPYRHHELLSPGSITSLVIAPLHIHAVQAGSYNPLLRVYRRACAKPIHQIKKRYLNRSNP
ncbi:hypothetical protein D3C77_579560 [compost metagenome]